ncbi:MAG TPA: SLBB domain-containing protein, partial [Actinomycetota bacterium]|nr:SLBB domain-containing protein [Actinomycetota bacterium]
MSRESLRDRLSALSRAELAGLAVVLAVTLGGAGLWYVRSLPRPVEVRTAEAPMPSGAPAHASPEPTILIVDVAGWVRRPGVYEFHEGDRVIDAIEAAGGARRGASLESLNLAM